MQIFTVRITHYICHKLFLMVQRKWFQSKVFEQWMDSFSEIAAHFIFVVASKYTLLSVYIIYIYTVYIDDYGTMDEPKMNERKSKQTC